jgi:hypothetical protein
MCIVYCAYQQDRVVFILANTVVSMETYINLSKTMILEEVMQEGDHCVSSFAHVRCLINEVIDLSWDTLTTHPKHSTLSGCFEIHWPWLEWVVRVVDLLGKIKRVVDHIWPTT